MRDICIVVQINGQTGASSVNIASALARKAVELNITIHRVDYVDLTMFVLLFFYYYCFIFFDYFFFEKILPSFSQFPFSLSLSFSLPFSSFLIQRFDPNDTTLWDNIRATGVRVIVGITSSFSQPLFQSAADHDFTGFPYIWYIRSLSLFSF